MTTTNTESKSAPATPVAWSWDEIRKQLEDRRTWISMEISEYPSPIAGCDAHINHLLAEREQVSEELARLEEAMKRGVAVEDFVRSSALLSK
jgi:hypothetical protein